MKRQLGISAALHLAALAALLITLPSLTQELDLSGQIIPVDIVNVADVSNTKISPTPTPKPTPTPTKTIAPQPVDQQQPKPPDPTTAPPKPPSPTPPEKQPTPDDKAETIPDKTKPPEKPKPPEPPKPEKAEEKPKEKPSPPKDALASVLKNIQKLKDTTPTSPTPNPDATEESDKPVTSTAAPAAGAQLTISELDALRRQITQCWNVPAGARGIETISVEIYMEVNPDRTLRRAEVVDLTRMATDSVFRTVAESALRALRNPKCSPLMLPEGKESEWGKIRMTFNPKDMM